MSSDDQLVDGIRDLGIDKAAKKRTGIVYDERMKKHHNLWEKTHPEVPERISRPYDKHREYGLLDRCKMIPARDATVEELLCQHSPEHVETVKSTQNMSLKELFTFGSQEYDSIYLSELHVNNMQFTETMALDDLYAKGKAAPLENDMYFSQHVYECACLSCGCTLAATEEVVTGKVQNAMAIVRPPGHHADTGFAMGYCYFNNVAIAAKIAQQKWNVKRVLIVDWDIHHGNGTQHLFESDPSVLYFSIHRYEHAKFFPSSTYANYDVVGQGPGKGYTVNVPWNKTHMGDGDYLAVFQHVLLPIAYEFAPDVVLVSAGFDSARGDPKGQCDVTPEGYCHMTNMLMGLAGGKVVIVLEGGYNLTSVEESMCACTSTLLGDSCPRFEEALVPSDSALETIANVVGEHQKYWKSLRYLGPGTSTEKQVEKTEEENEKHPLLASEAELPIDYICKFSGYQVTPGLVCVINQKLTVKRQCRPGDPEARRGTLGALGLKK